MDLQDAETVARAAQSIRPSVIYHLATHGAYPFQTDAEAILLTNVFGLWNLLTACEKQGYDLFVNTGSSSEYGRKLHAMRETDVLEPDSYYAVAKSAQSLLCRHCSHTSRLPIVTLRLFSVYGPFEEPTRLIPTLMNAALNDAPIGMVSPTVARDFIYVDDVVDAYMDIEHLMPLRGEILNVGTGLQTNLGEVISILETVIGRSLQVTWGSIEARTWDSEVWVADISKAKRLTGQSKRTPLLEGFEKSLQWFHTHQALYRGS